jgi:hypothetical protein
VASSPNPAYPPRNPTPYPQVLAGLRVPVKIPPNEYEKVKNNITIDTKQIFIGVMILLRFNI